MMRGRKGLAIAHGVEATSPFREFYDTLWHSLSPLTENLELDRPGSVATAVPYHSFLQYEDKGC